MDDILEQFEVFPWNRNLETGIAQIDEQHKQIVHLLNKLAGHLALKSSSVELNEVFGELAAYADHHFKSEEAIWEPYFREDLKAATLGHLHIENNQRRVVFPD